MEPVKTENVYRPAVYRLFDVDGNLLYIGQTGGDLTGRLNSHRGKPWGHLIARREIQWFGTVAEAKRAEAEAIRAEDPPYNIARPFVPLPANAHRTRERLVGAQEIGRMLGVNRQRVQQIASHKSFPEPFAVLHMGKVWAAADVEKWARGKGRTIHDY